MAVTRRQKEILDFLETFVTRNGYSPSFEEIARGMGLKSLATVHKHITNLEKKGMLDRVHNRSRSIDVLPPGTRTARQGEIVVALVHGAETTLKRFYSEGNVIRLQPANMEMEPIYVPAAQVAIQGRVLGVLRKYR